MIVPKKDKQKQILHRYVRECSDKKHGAIVRTARRFGFSRQYIEQLIKKFSKYIEKISFMETTPTFTCKVCLNEIGINFKQPVKKELCRHCYENQIKRCSSCGANFIGDYSKKQSYCTPCNSTRTKEYIKKYLSDPERSVEFKKIRQETVKRHINKHGVKDHCACGRPKYKNAKKCRYCNAMKGKK